MTSLSASEARRRWFEVLDRVAAGEVMVIERNGRRIILQRDDEPAHGASTPDYSALLVPLADAERADEWSWEWSEDAGLHPRPGDHS
jgi:antitoxin (DNA-binding transcriptional repressor) of toxin-antitoxin stability system